MKKYFLTIFTIFLLSQYVIAQKINENQRNALNSYTKLINSSVNNLTKTVKCLSKYYDEVENYKKRKRGLYTSYICLEPLDKILIEQTTSITKSLSSSKRKSLNSKTTKLLSSYKQLLTKCHELDIYIGLKDFETDNFAQSDSILNELEVLLLSYRKIKRELEYTVFTTYRQMQPYNRNNKIHVAEQQMRKTIDNEKALMDLFSFNLNKNVHSNIFPLEQLIANVNQVDIESTNKNFIPDFNNQILHFYNLFYVDKNKTIQTIKRTCIDKYSYHEQQNDRHTNYTYTTLLNYLNNALIVWYESFTNSTTMQGVNTIIPCKYLPVFHIINHPVTIVDKPIRFTKQQLQSPTIILSESSIPKEIAYSLNKYIAFINSEIRSQKIFILHLSSFNSEVNSKQKLVKENESINFSVFNPFNNYNSSRSEYEKAINYSRYLPIYYKDILNSQTKALWTIISEREQLSVELYKYSKEKIFMDDYFVRAKDILKRLEFLLKTFDKQKNILYKDICKIYASYKANNSNNPWVKSGNILSETIDYNRSVLLHTKNFCRGINKKLPATDTLNTFVRQTLMDKYKNMEGLTKLGSNNGLCPYNYYTNIPQDSKMLGNRIQSMAGQISKSRDSIRFCDNYINPYNKIVTDYNEYVDIAKGESEKTQHKGIKPIYLLYQVKEPVLFELRSPKKHEVISEKKYITEINDSLFTTMKGYAVNNLVFLLDISSSMNRPNKLPLLKSSLRRLLKIMRTDDKIAIVSYSGKAKIVLKSTSSQETAILKAIKNLQSGGESNADKGIKLSYQVAEKNFLSEGNNRIILATDGEFEISTKTKNMVEKYAKQNINISIFIYGKQAKNKDYVELKTMAINGNGNFRQITTNNTDTMLVKEVKAIK